VPKNFSDDVSILALPASAEQGVGDPLQHGHPAERLIESGFPQPLL